MALDNDSVDEDDIAAMEQQMRRIRQHGARERMGSDLDDQSDGSLSLLVCAQVICAHTSFN